MAYVCVEFSKIQSSRLHYANFLFLIGMMNVIGQLCNDARFIAMILYLLKIRWIRIVMDKN
jgi:hypothetical protein